MCTIVQTWLKKTASLFLMLPLTKVRKLAFYHCSCRWRSVWPGCVNAAGAVWFFFQLWAICGWTNKTHVASVGVGSSTESHHTIVPIMEHLSLPKYGRLGTCLCRAFLNSTHAHHSCIEGSRQHCNQSYDRIGYGIPDESRVQHVTV